MGLRARVQRTIRNYARLFAQPHRKATLITLGVAGAIFMVPAVIHALFHRAAARVDFAVGISYFVFFGAIIFCGRQVWITDDYDRAERAAAEAERVRQQAQREREARRIIPPSAASSYAILGLNENATDIDIKTSFRKLVKRYHPDRSRYSRAANAEKFRQVQEAYAEIRIHRGF